MGNYKRLGDYIQLVDNRNKDLVVRDFRTTSQHGAMEGKTQTKNVKYYNLDVEISVGYRVKAHRGVNSKKWTVGSE
ncbi:MAG: virulence RhuM family protein [Spirochaetaceae bacterium]|nr:virulence RhuM family protein [Spirochaetaceae bacterium]